MGESAESRTLLDVQEPLDAMTNEQIRAECQNWRNIFSYIPQEYKWWLSRIGQQVIVFKRTGGYMDGSYQGCKVEITKHEIKTFERIRSQVEKKFFLHDTTTVIPESNITDFKFVSARYDDTPNPWDEPSNEERVNEKIESVNEIESDGINQNA